MSFRVELCACCRTRTDRENGLKYRKCVINMPDWFQQAIKIENKEIWNSNPYICYNCYRTIPLSFTCSNPPDFNQFLETEGAEDANT